MTVICTFVYGSVKEVSNICVLAMKVPITTILAPTYAERSVGVVIKHCLKTACTMGQIC